MTRIEKVKKEMDSSSREREREGILKNIRPRMSVFCDVTR